MAASLVLQLGPRHSNLFVKRNFILKVKPLLDLAKSWRQHFRKAQIDGDDLRLLLHAQPTKLIRSENVPRILLKERP